MFSLPRPSPNNEPYSNVLRAKNKEQYKQERQRTKTTK